MPCTSASRPRVLRLWLLPPGLMQPSYLFFGLCTSSDKPNLIDGSAPTVAIDHRISLFFTATILLLFITIFRIGFLSWKSANRDSAIVATLLGIVPVRPWNPFLFATNLFLETSLKITLKSLNIYKTSIKHLQNIRSLGPFPTPETSPRYVLPTETPRHVLRRCHGAAATAAPLPRRHPGYDRSEWCGSPPRDHD